MKLKLADLEDSYDDVTSSYLDVVHKIVKNSENYLTPSDIQIIYHYVVGEYCVWIKGKWSGYLDPQNLDDWGV